MSYKRYWRTRLVFISTLVLFLFASAIKCTLFRLLLSDLKISWQTDSVLHFFLYYFLLNAIFYLFVLRANQKWLLIFSYLAQSLFLSVNITYFFYFETYLHLNQYFHLWREALQLIKHSAMPFEPRVLVSFIDLPFLIGIFFFYSGLRLVRQSLFFRYSIYVPCIILIFNFKKWTLSNEENPFRLMNDRYTSEHLAVKNFGILTVNIVNLISLDQNKRNLKILQNKGNLIGAAKVSSKQIPDFVLIQVESMDSHIIDKKHHGNYITPFLNQVSRSSVYYPYTLSYHQAGSTSDCEFSVINSIEPLRYFPTMKIRNYDFPNSVARVLGQGNFRVAAFHGNKGFFFNRRIAFRKMGFGAFYDILDMRLREVVWGAPDGQVFNFVEKSISSTSAPLFFYVITMSSHEPFSFVKPYYINPKLIGIPDKKTGNFFQSMSYVDSTLQKFVFSVRKMRPNTFIFIYGDHTPGIRSEYYKQSAFKEGGRYFEFVPLLILTPDSSKYREKTRVASFLDIAVTIFSLSNVKSEFYSYGINLLEPQQDFPAIPYQGSWQDREVLFQKITGSNRRN